MNIVLIILDTLRRDHLGAYGNSWVQTPHLDAVAAESLVMTRAYPESEPTIPVRRAMYTGRRTFPFRDHRMNRRDRNAVSPGWGPIPSDQASLAEALAPLGFRSALITDTWHLFQPWANFQRGFAEWHWIRGQEMDNFRSAADVSDAELARRLPRSLRHWDRDAALLRQYLQNTAYRSGESDYFAPRVFRKAARWIEENANADRFFLVIDSFDPHEPWDPPAAYRRLYDDDDPGAIDVQLSLYGAWKGQLTPRELRRLQANYAAEVTLVDRWFGYFMETLAKSGRLADTVVAVMSDHGMNLGYGPGDKGLVSKFGHPLTHAVADLVMVVRHPSGRGAGIRSGALAYNVDLIATVLGLAKADVDIQLDGLDFWDAAVNGAPWPRTHVTVAMGTLVTVVTDEWWYNATIWGDAPLLHRVHEDPMLETNVASAHPQVCAELRRLAVDDAGGRIPGAFANYAKLDMHAPNTHLSRTYR